MVVLGDGRADVYCALIGYSHRSCDAIGWKIERAVIPYDPIFIGPVHSSDLPHFTIGPCSGQSVWLRTSESDRIAAPLDFLKHTVQTNLYYYIEKFQSSTVFASLAAYSIILCSIANVNPLFQKVQEIKQQIIDRSL